MGVDRSYISGLELAQRNPTIVTLWHLAKSLGVHIGSFFEKSWRVGGLGDEFSGDLAGGATAKPMLVYRPFMVCGEAPKLLTTIA